MLVHNNSFEFSRAFFWFQLFIQARNRYPNGRYHRSNKSAFKSSPHLTDRYCNYFFPLCFPDIPVSRTTAHTNTRTRTRTHTHTHTHKHSHTCIILTICVRIDRRMCTVIHASGFPVATRILYIPGARVLIHCQTMHLFCSDTEPVW